VFAALSIPLLSKTVEM